MPVMCATWGWKELAQNLVNCVFDVDKGIWNWTARRMATATLDDQMMRRWSDRILASSMLTPETASESLTRKCPDYLDRVSVSWRAGSNRQNQAMMRVCYVCSLAVQNTTQDELPWNVGTNKDDELRELIGESFFWPWRWPVDDAHHDYQDPIDLPSTKS